MYLFRIAKTKYINDLSGVGARVYGGRWNEKGVAVVYTSESRALAALEFLVHTPMALAPKDLSIMTIHIPDSIKPKPIDLAHLPKNWDMHPAPDALAQIGSLWARSNASLLLKVPSVLINEEHNIIINPNHPDFKHLKASSDKFNFDDRYFKR